MNAKWACEPRSAQAAPPNPTGFNIANVLLVRATAREREMGVRAALGAGRGRLIRQHLTESCCSRSSEPSPDFFSPLGCRISQLAPARHRSAAALRFLSDARVYAFAFAAVLVTAVVVGLVPALRVARADVNSLLREGGRSSSDGRKRHIVRNTLVAAQLAGSMLLLITAGLFVRSLGKAEQLNVGFNPAHILNLNVDVNQLNYPDAQGRTFFKQLADRIAATPGVVSTAQAFTVPLGVVSADDAVTLPGKEIPAGQQPPHVMKNMVTPDYFATMQIPIRAGRAFTDSDDEKAPDVAIVNETMARQFWPGQNALGQHFSNSASSGRLIEVVGIVPDAMYKEISEEHKTPYFYVPLAQEYIPMRTIHVRTAGAPEAMAAQIQSEIRELAPGLAITQVQSMEQSLQGVNGFFFFRFGAQLTGAMGVLGLILAVVGVFSMVSYAAAQTHPGNRHPHGSRRSPTRHFENGAAPKRARGRHRLARRPRDRARRHPRHRHAHHRHQAHRPGHLHLRRARALHRRVSSLLLPRAPRHKK